MLIFEYLNNLWNSEYILYIFTLWKIKKEGENENETDKPKFSTTSNRIFFLQWTDEKNRETHLGLLVGKEWKKENRNRTLKKQKRVGPVLGDLCILSTICCLVRQIRYSQRVGRIITGLALLGSSEPSPIAEFCRIFLSFLVERRTKI